MKGFLKSLIVSFIVWILGVFAFSALLYWDFHRNFDPTDLKATEGDTLSIPIAGFAFLLSILIVAINVVLFLWKRNRS